MEDRSNMMEHPLFTKNDHEQIRKGAQALESHIQHLKDGLGAVKNGRSAKTYDAQCKRIRYLSQTLGQTVPHGTLPKSSCSNAEAWAGALLDTLVAPHHNAVANPAEATPATGSSVGGKADSHDVNAASSASSALFRLALQVQCAPVHERPRVLCNVKSSLHAAIATLESLASADPAAAAVAAQSATAAAAPAAAPVAAAPAAAAPAAAPAAAAPAAAAPVKQEPPAEPCDGTPAAGADLHAVHAAPATAVLSAVRAAALAQLNMTARVNPKPLNKCVTRAVMASEKNTKTKVMNLEAELGAPIPMYARFARCDTPLSMQHTAALTSRGFFRACAAAAQAVAPLELADLVAACHQRAAAAAAAAAGSAAPPAATTPPACVRAGGISGEVVSVFVQVMDSSAPSALTLQQALHVFELIHCSGSRRLAVPFAEFLAPLIEKLDSWQFVYVLCHILCCLPDASLTPLVLKALIAPGLKNLPILPPPTENPPSSAAAAANAPAPARPNADAAACPAAGAPSTLPPPSEAAGSTLRPPAPAAYPAACITAAAACAAPDPPPGPTLDDADSLTLFATSAFSAYCHSTQHAAHSTDGGVPSIVECCLTPHMPAWLKAACVAAACMHVREWTPEAVESVLRAACAVWASGNQGVSGTALMRRVMLRLVSGPLHAAQMQIACRVLHRLSQREAGMPAPPSTAGRKRPRPIVMNPVL